MKLLIRLMITLLALLFLVIFSIEDINSCQYGYVFNGIECEECGTTGVNPNVRIVGGLEAVPHSWPAQALVLQDYKADLKVYSDKIVTITRNFACGGTLINRYTILTAAHCIVESFIHYYEGVYYDVIVTPNKYYPTSESMFKVVLGVHDIFKIDNDKLIVNASIKRIIRHPLYDESTQANDIALIILKEPVKLNTNIRVACMPKDRNFSYPPINSISFAAGWGTLQEEGAMSEILYNVKLRVYDKAFCSLVYPEIPKNFDAQICAGNYSGGHDTCQGDSGGGLYISDMINGKPRYVVSGITSYGDGCGQSKKPGIYTRVSYYLPWIYENWQTLETLEFETNKATKLLNINSVSIYLMLCLVLTLFYFY